MKIITIKVGSRTVFVPASPSARDIAQHLNQLEDIIWAMEGDGSFIFCDLVRASASETQERMLLICTVEPA